MKAFCCIAFLLLLIRFSHQQLPSGRCEPFQGAPLSQCGSVVNYDVFVPAGMSQSDLDRLAADKNGVFRLGLTSVSCTEDAMLFICAEAFRRCSVVELGDTRVALPQPTCRRRCDQFVDRCSAQVQAIGSSIDVQCDAVSPTTGSPVFPPSATILNLPNGAVARLPCNNPDFVAPYVEIPRARCATLTALDTPSSGCANVITGSVYLPAGYTLEELDAAAAAKTILARSGTLSKRCSDAMMEFVCAEAYRRCNEIVVDPRIRAITLPSNTCYEDCYRFRGECTAELVRLTLDGKIPRSAPVVCEAENPALPGTQPLYPPEETIYNLQGNVFSVPCSYPKVTAPYNLPTCEPFAGYPEECASVVDYDVLILPGRTQEQLAAQAKVGLAAFQAAPTSCRQLALRLLCSTIFIRCAPQGISPAVTVNLPAFTCQSFCQETKKICEAVSPTDTTVDCDLMSNGQRVYPEKDSRTILGGEEYVVPCYIPTYTSDGYPELEECPYPLEMTGDDEEVCNIQCPLPVFSEGEFMAHMITVTVLAYLSFFLGTLTAFSFVLHPLKRTFPRNLVMLQVTAATLKSIGYLIPHWVYSGGYAYHDVICTDSTTLARGSHAPCAAQSFFLYVFGFSQVLWYFMVALFLVRAAFSVRIPSAAFYPLQILLHLICWAVPLILWICLISTDNISSSGVYPCFADASKWNYTFYGVLFYYPVTAVLLSGMLMVAIAVITILKHTGRRGLSKQFRLLLYLLYTFLSNGYVVFDHYYIRANRAKYDENLERFALCSAASLEPCELHGSLPYGFFMAYGVIYASQPLFFALILLLDVGIWKTWYWSIRKYILCEDVDVLEKLGLQKGARKVKRRITQDNNHPISRVSRSDLEYSDDDWAGE